MEGLYKNKKDEEIFTRAYIDNMYKFYGYGIWIICLKENDKIIGRAGISNREVDEETKLELGYVVGVSYQHKGYAIEACQAILEFAKEELLEKEIVCFMDKENKPSINLAEKLGFMFMEELHLETGGKQKTYLYYKKQLI